MRLPLRSLVALLTSSCAIRAAANDLQVRIETGTIEGRRDGDVRAFLGIPFAAPPVGDLRWKPPTPPAKWPGVRRTVEFGPRPMQTQVWKDMVFRDAGPSEDCLTLNVWAPDNLGHRPLPVMVWIFGGGYQAGGTSEPRQDGTNLARKGVLVVSMNYRLNVFGFLVHPGLAAESPSHATGNYGLMDQQAALRWVHRNIARFGGDPNNITLFGESAGSFSVAQQMGSPGNKGLFQRAIGESGGLPLGGALADTSRSVREAHDPDLLAKLTGARTLAELRALPADKLLRDVAAHDLTTLVNFIPTVDGEFISEPLPQIFAEGHQNDVPLLAGWNHDERTPDLVPGGSAAEALRKLAAEKYGKDADAFLAGFPGRTDAEAYAAGTAYANSQFISLSAWSWMEVQARTGHAPVYRYLFNRAPPTDFFGIARGSYHSAEILYVFGTLDSQTKTPWAPEDRRVSELTMGYWVNFAKFGNPNGPGLPPWPIYNASTSWSVLRIDTSTEAKPDEYRAGYQFLRARP